MESNAPKRSRHQRLVDIKDIGEKLAQEWTHQSITDWLAANRPYTLSRQMISADCKVAVAMWRKDTVEAIEIAKHRDLAKVSAIEKRAWRMLDKSEGEATETEMTTDGSGTAKKARGKITKRTRDGNPRFLQVILTCLERRAKILGYDAPTKTEISGPDGAPLAITPAKSTLDLETIKALAREQFGATQPPADPPKPNA